jgi:hypothetical protein
MQDYLAFMKAKYPEADPADQFALFGYSVGNLTIDLLQRAGNNLTRDNIMKMATSFKDYRLPLALPGIVVSNSWQDRNLFKQVQLVRFKGEGWERFGEVIGVN